MKTSLADVINAEAAQCVKCGLCLPHCPTYVKTQHEGESPRGRIALLQGMAENQLSLTASAKTYVDHCLACRACEVVCPAKVKYGQLFVHGQTLMSKLSSKKSGLSLKKLILFLLPYLYLCRKKYPESKEASVALLPGCIHSFYEKNILKDTMLLLDNLNISYSILNNFRCCGGLHQHAGDDKTVQKLKDHNTILFKPFSVILSTATGCSAILSEQFNQDNSDNTQIIQDITVFLSQFDFSLRPIDKNKKILLHSPCTLKNMLRQEDSVEQLLRKIPDINLLKLKHPHCCGASGMYFLEYPQMAEKLASDIEDEVKSLSPDIFITSNIGCALHLRRQFKKHQIKIKILHPVNVLASQLIAKSAAPLPPLQ